MEDTTVTPPAVKADLLLLQALDDAASTGLIEDGRLTVVEAAGVARMRQTVTRNHLNRLVESGYVQRRDMTLPGKPHVHGYSITPMGCEYLDRLVQGETDGQ